MKNKPKVRRNLGKDIETKPVPPIMPRQQPKFYALPGNLRVEVIDALLTSSPKHLCVGDINRICSDFERLLPISINNAPQKPEGKTDGENKT